MTAARSRGHPWTQGRPVFAGVVTCGPSLRLLDILVYMCASWFEWAENSDSVSTSAKSSAQPKAVSVFATREPRKRRTRVSKETAKGS